MDMDRSTESKTVTPTVYEIESFFPGCVYQMASVTLPVTLISSLGNNSYPIGRATLYYLEDVYSKMVVGFNIGSEKPSYSAFALALGNSIENKVRFCERYGFKNVRWACNSIPAHIVVENRPEFAGINLANLASLGIGVHYAPQSQDLKGSVERIKQNLSQLPESVSGYRRRGELDERFCPKLTFDDLTKIVISNILNYNATVIPGYVGDRSVWTNDVPPTPNDLWEHGIAVVGGSGRLLPNDNVFVNLLPKGKASINKRGILFDGRYYHCKDATQNDWYVKHSGEKLNIAYDPRNVNDIYILEEKETRYITCSLPKNSPFLNVTLDECKTLRTEKEMLKFSDTSTSKD